MLNLPDTIRDDLFAGDCFDICWKGQELDDKIKVLLEPMTKKSKTFKFCEQDKIWGPSKIMEKRGHKDAISIKS